MAAALYLHNALFANEPPPSPPSLAHRPATNRTPHDRHLSSVSSVTLRTTTSEYFHPAEPLLQNSYPESSAYHELLAGQPGHPETPGDTALRDTALSLDADPIGHRERRRHWELTLRKRLRRLRWAKKAVLLLIGSWAVYNSVRYFVALTVYTTHDRQLILLILGTATSLAVALIFISFALSFFAPHIGWKQGSQTIYATVQSILGSTSCLLLLGPAIVNFVFVFLWKTSSVPSDSIQGRCNWDIDVLWSGTGSQCDSNHATSWGFWLVGAIIRLVLTIAVVIGYHILSQKYGTTRRPSRRRRARTHNHSISYPSLTGTNVTASPQSLRTMATTNYAPVSIGHGGRQNSQSTVNDSDFTHESAMGSEQHLLRTSGSRILSQSQPHGRDCRYSVPGQSHPEPHAESPTSSSEEDFSGTADVSAYAKYGRPLRRTPGAYSLVAANSSQMAHSPSSAEAGPSSPPPSQAPPNRELNGFVDRFRALIDQVTREIDAGLEFAQNDRPGFYTDRPNSPSPPTTPRPPHQEDANYFPYMGRLVQRMPTIESLSSREVMSLATSSSRGERSTHSTSRPPTRSNTLSLNDGSRPSSRGTNVTLSPGEGPSGGFALLQGGQVNELGELSAANTLLHNSGGTFGQRLAGSRSTGGASYYTAGSSGSTQASVDSSTKSEADVERPQVQTRMGRR